MYHTYRISAIASPTACGRVDWTSSMRLTSVSFFLRHGGQTVGNDVCGTSAKHTWAGRQAASRYTSPRGTTVHMAKLKSWYVRKHYLHFDLPLGKTRATEYVTDPIRVSQHPFYPLMGYTLRTPRIKKCPRGSARPFVKESKNRPIAYPAHKDGYIFSYYKSILEGLYEEWLEVNGLEQAVIAFRSIGENNVTLAKKAFNFIKANPGCQIVATDVESFFANLDHGQLKRTWARLLGVSKLPCDHYAVYKAVTQYSVVERHKVYNLFGIRLSGRLNKDDGPKRLCTPEQFRDKVIPRGLVKPGSDASPRVGIPQGTSLSPLLSNMYMADLDLAMYDWITSLGGAYWRYCDDILIVLPKGRRPPILRRLDSELKALRLKRSKPKTQNINGNHLSARKQLQYLGFMFNGSETVVRPSSIHRYHRKLKKGIRAAEIRQSRETFASGLKAPFRQQALYNMYSDLPTRGKNIQKRKMRQKYNGNFTTYMKKSAKLMDSVRIIHQHQRLLKRFRTSIQKHK